MGSHGSIPLTVIAPLADIFRHMSVFTQSHQEVALMHEQIQSHRQGRKGSHPDNLLLESIARIKAYQRGSKSPSSSRYSTH